MAQAKGFQTGRTETPKKANSGGVVSTHANRPAGREKKIGTGGGNAYRRGAGLGCGTVGNAFSGNGTKNNLHQSFSSPPSASGGEYAARPNDPPNAQRPDFSFFQTRLSEMLQQRASLTAAREEKQAALSSAKLSANTIQRNLIHEKQLELLNISLEKLKQNLAQTSLQRSANNASTYTPPPVARPFLSRQSDVRKELDNASYLTDNMKQLSKLISVLPASFPIDQFDSMTPRQQLAAVGRTKLSREEQWVLLNAKTNILPLSKVMNIQENRLRYGLTQTAADSICQQLLAIDNARIGVSNREIPFHTDRQRTLYLKMLEQQEEQLLKSIGYNAKQVDTAPSFMLKKSVSENVVPSGSNNTPVGEWVGSDSIDLTEDLHSLMETNAASFNRFCKQNQGRPDVILGYFIDISKTGSILDIKNKEAWQFMPGVKYYYDEKELRSDDIGNMLFGYVGASEYPLWFLQMGAGAYQIKSGTSDFEYAGSYFDDPRDSDMIKYGYQLYWQEHAR